MSKVCWPRLNIPAKNASAFNRHSKYLNHIIKKLNLNVFTIKCGVFCTVDFTYAVPLLGEQLKHIQPFFNAG